MQIKINNIVIKLITKNMMKKIIILIGLIVISVAAFSQTKPAKFYDRGERVYIYDHGGKEYFIKKENIVLVTTVGNWIQIQVQSIDKSESTPTVIVTLDYDRINSGAFSSVIDAREFIEKVVNNDYDINLGYNGDTTADSITFSIDGSVQWLILQEFDANDNATSVTYQYVK